MNPGGGLDATVEVTRGDFRLRADVGIPPGGVLAVLGPNGSGKSTLLECIAGLRHPHGGSVTLGDRTLTDVARGVHIPPHRRGIGVLGQAPLLFPHCTAQDNVAFGPRARGAGRAAARKVAREWMERLAVAELAARKPHQLSGGQAQRVALARTLADEPGLVLLDEPLAALDADAGPAMRAVLGRVLRDGDAARCGLLVTHDPLDALTLADSVIVLSDGAVVERGATREVLAAPRTPFTARIAGLNLVTGRAVAGGLRTVDGAVLSAASCDGVPVGSPAVAVFPPGNVAVHPGHPAQGRGAGNHSNSGSAVVESLEPHGSVVRVRIGVPHDSPEHAWVAGLTADVAPAAVAELGLEPGHPVEVAVPADAVGVHEAFTGRS
ncbi:molybdate transport system ATP-binding protein [Haloechinothrix alba]|uniref:Molybdate transport system ATP-binding protein n=1 Tax=Haloechinothrix alba TaxID=664784 RepID=A0A238XDU9_9PSEU|nr:ABC transporter ATP-binding protein [Haloechinothrix alba]SNR56514.1 molybdate transport system ATP-binding protein [Haloechinothrix alba]